MRPRTLISVAFLTLLVATGAESAGGKAAKNASRRPEGADSKLPSAKQGETTGSNEKTPKEGLALTGRVTDKTTGAAIANALARANGRGVAKGMSDGNGFYRLEGLAEGRFRVFVMAKGHVPGLASVSVGQDSPNVLDFALEPGAEVDAFVKDKEGKPIVGARVRSSDAYLLGGQEGAITGADGHAIVDGISRTAPDVLSASKDGYSYGDHIRPEFKAFEARGTVTFTLRPSETNKGGVFTGQVTDEEGKGLAGACVTWFYTYNYPKSGADRAYTDSQGLYRLSTTVSTQPGFSLTAMLAGYAAECKYDVMPGTEESPARVDFALPLGHWLACVVVDEEDKPVKGVVVAASPGTWRPGGHQFAGFPNNLRSDAEGKFRVKDVPGPELRLNLYREGWGNVSKTISVDKETKITMTKLGVIRGQAVDDKTSAPIAEFTVKVRGGAAGPDLYRNGQRFTAPDGRFTLRGMDQGGSFEVIVEAAGRSPASESGVKPAPEENAEENVFRLAAGWPIKGVVVDAVSQAPLPEVAVSYGVARDNFTLADWDHLGGDMRNFRNFQRVVTGADGGFVVSEGLADKGVLLLQGASHQRLIIGPNDRDQYAFGEGLRIPIKVGATVTGVCIRQGLPEPGALMQLTTCGGAGDILQDFENKRTDSEAKHRWDGLAPGRYSVSVMQEDPGLGFERLSRVFDLSDGETKTVNLGDDLGPCVLHGRVFDMDKPVPGVLVSAYPASEWDYGFEARSDQEGRYHIEGLRAGKYRLQTLKFDVPGAEGRFEMKAAIEVKEDTEHDIVFHKGNKVTARLAFAASVADDVRSRFSAANLQTTQKNAGAQKDDPEAVQQSGASPIDGGRVTFYGRFQGDYRLSLEYRIGDYRATSVRLPVTVRLDNLAADQDLGDVQVPDLGTIRVVFALDSLDAPQPRYIPLALFPAEDHSKYETFYLEPDLDEQNAGPFPPRDYMVGIWTPGYKSDPELAPVTVAPGQSPMVTFILHPVGEFRGRCKEAGDKTGKKIRLSRVTLTGPGVSREVAPDAKWASNPYLAYLEEGDRSSGGSFLFQKLPPGEYEATVEAEGYEIARVKRTVVPGKGGGAEETVELTPAGSGK